MMMKNNGMWLFLVAYYAGLISSNVKTSAFGFLPGLVIFLVIALGAWHVFRHFLNRDWTRKP
ncbi:hypothetical protein ACQZ4Q_08185 [Agrobacterium vitis]